MRDLFFLFRAALFALLLLYFLLRPLRHCYTLEEEARQKEFLWKGGGGAEEEFFCSAKSCFCLSFVSICEWERPRGTELSGEFS